MPVYFAVESDRLLEVYNDLQSYVSKPNQQSSAVSELFNSVTGNGFQFVYSGQQSKPQPDFVVYNIQGKLSGLGIEERLPTIAIIAHYDSYGVTPGLSYGVDSNGSGVIVLLELARLFSKLYANPKTHARYNILFLLSGGGKFNYQGTKRWIEDHIDTGATDEGTLLSDISYALCLDSLGQGDTLYMHVSKPPKENSPAGLLQTCLENTAQSKHKINFKLVHKKINLADDFLSWEHERFSIRRLPAVTLSHFSSHADVRRGTILDTRPNVNVDVLVRNTYVIVEAVTKHLYNRVNDSETLSLFGNEMEIRESINGWLDLFESQPRAQQLLTLDNPLLIGLQNALARHVKDVQLFSFTAEKRDPDFLFFSGSSGTMSAHSVKPAVFDLFLAMCIAAYIGVIYLLVNNFHLVHSSLKKVLGPIKAKHL